MLWHGFLVSDDYVEYKKLLNHKLQSDEFFLIVDATRGVYRRKLERLLLEQSILSSSSVMESPPKESQQMKAPEKEATQSLRPSVNAAEEFEDDLELDEICEGSLRLEDDESEDDFLDEHRIGRCESGRSEFGLKGVRPMNDVSSARERRFPESDDIFAAGRNLFVPGEILSFNFCAADVI